MEPKTKIHCGKLNSFFSKETLRKKEEEERDDENLAVRKAEIIVDELHTKGIDYFYGQNDRKKNHRLSIVFFEKLMRYDEKRAHAGLFVVYGFGNSKIQDLNLAINHGIKAVKLKNYDVLLALAMTYEKLTPPRYDKSAEYYRLSWLYTDDEKGHALSNLGRYYYLGLGVDKDIEYAKSLFKLSIKNSQYSNSDAMFNLGSIFYECDEYKKAIELFDQAAKLGNNDALFNLGICLKDGSQKDNIPSDFEKAEKCFQKLADRKYYSAWNELGLIELEKKNLLMAHRNFIVGANLGDWSSTKNLWNYSTLNKTRYPTSRCPNCLYRHRLENVIDFGFVVKCEVCKHRNSLFVNDRADHCSYQAKVCFQCSSNSKVYFG